MAAAANELLDTVVLQWLPDQLQPALDLLAEYPLLMLPLVVVFGYLAGKLLQLIMIAGVGAADQPTHRQRL